MKAETPTLDYGRARRSVARRWGRRVAAVAALVCLAMIWQFGKPALRQAAVLRLQDRIGSFRLPSTFVVYQADVTTDMPRPLSMRFEEIRAASADYTYSFVPRNRRGFDSIGYIPSDYRQFADTELLVKEWTSTLFLGERLSPSGKRRIVVVGLRQCRAADDDGLFYSPEGFTYEPATWQFGSKPVFEDIAGVNLPGMRCYFAGVRIFAGQADPHDGGHFTIDYEIQFEPEEQWKRFRIDGYLRESGRVDLSASDGPLKR